MIEIWRKKINSIKNFFFVLSVASLLSCLHQLRTENVRLEDHVGNLLQRRDHLLAVNARLAIPLTTGQYPEGPQLYPGFYLLLTLSMSSSARILRSFYQFMYSLVTTTNTLRYSIGFISRLSLLTALMIQYRIKYLLWASETGRKCVRVLHSSLLIVLARKGYKILLCLIENSA